jgi:lipopolysaccharide transport system ATP-binding protein
MKVVDGLPDGVSTEGMNFQKKCLDKMMGFGRKGVTMVFVSHSMADVEKICDRAIWIEDHSIMAIGNPVEVVQNYLS